MQYRDFVLDIGPGTSLRSHYEGETKEGSVSLNDGLKSQIEEFLDEEQVWTADQVLSFGDDLRKALFGGEIAVHFEKAFKLASATKKGLRVVLRICSAYASYPWEAMCRDGTPMSINKETPVVRGLKGANKPINLEDKPLKILIIASNNVDMNHVDSEDEIEEIEREIGETTEPVEKPDVEDNATRENIESKIKKKNYNVIHFIGHGDFDLKKDTGYLALRMENGHADLASEADIKHIFLNQQTVGLMLLNACDSAQISERVGSGLVPKLIERVPAVISMRNRISSEAAIAFSRGFYLNLLGKNIEEIIQEARQSMFTNNYLGKDPRDFSVPVLFLGLGDDEENPAVVSKSGSLFQKSMTSPEPQVLSPSLIAEREPAVSVLAGFLDAVIGELHMLQSAVDECTQLKEQEDKTQRAFIARTSRGTSALFKANIEKLSKEIESKFPDTYLKIADTSTTLDIRIEQLRDCFGRIAESIDKADETMTKIREDLRELYVATVRGILQESSKGQKEGSGH